MEMPPSRADLHACIVGSYENKFAGKIMQMLQFSRRLEYVFAELK